MAGKPSLSPSNPCPLTSPPEKRTLHMLGARCQGISTSFATRPTVARRYRALKRSPASPKLPTLGCPQWRPDQLRTASRIGAPAPRQGTLPRVICDRPASGASTDPCQCGTIDGRTQRDLARHAANIPARDAAIPAAERGVGDRRVWRAMHNRQCARKRVSAPAGPAPRKRRGPSPPGGHPTKPDGCPVPGCRNLTCCQRLLDQARLKGPRR
jgi:hypothetical protein